MPRRLPALNALKAFEAAARHESFTRAAEELCVTQGAVSHQVKALEAELGIKLFNRERQRLAITEAGRAYLAVVRDAFDRIASGTERLLQRQDAGALTVSLVATTEERIVGHVALSPVAVNGITAGQRWLGLAPLAVRPEWQRRGIGADLVHAALAIAGARQAALVFVLGRPSYYDRLGFEAAAPLGWRCVYEVPEPAFRVHRLADGVAPREDRRPGRPRRRRRPRPHPPRSPLQPSRW